MLKPCRSALFLPASNPRAIEKARTLPCDAVILDLEDAVAPEAKAAARQSAVAAVREGFGARLTVIRINALDTPWGADDLAAVFDLGIDAVLAPKVRNAVDALGYARALAGPKLWVMIETARAIGQLASIADCAEAGLAGLVVGTNDLALEMRCAGRAALAPLLPLIVAAGRSAGLLVLDGVRNDFADLAAFATEADEGAALGFDGKTLIHPAQIAPCNAAFSPSAAAVARARAVVDAFALPDNAGKGAIRLDGGMVERLHLAEAERVLALAALDVP